ncbi:MAG: hypothetical protein N2047_04065 [Meiothermus sp.]|nr:hypothetical protein [Meiothermus sp.]
MKAIKSIREASFCLAERQYTHYRPKVVKRMKKQLHRGYRALGKAQIKEGLGEL